MKRVMTAVLAGVMVFGVAATANAQRDNGRVNNPELERGAGTPLQPGPGSVEGYRGGYGYEGGYGYDGTVGYGGYEGNPQIYDGTGNRGNLPPNAAPGGRVNSHEQ